MAYSEQTFTNLGTVQQPDASQSTAFAGSNPFAFSESTNQLLNQVSQLAVKKREDEVKMYNENLQTALTKAGNIPDDLSPQDYEVVSKKVKEYYKKLYENPETLLGQNPEKSRELRSLENELGTQTDTLAQRKSAIGTNPDATDSLQNDVTYTQGKISDINSKITQLKTEIVTLERNTRDKLKQMKDGLANNKKKLDYFIKAK